MSGNTFGHLFRVSTWGESHGRAVGAVIDGCPPRLPISVEEIQRELDRRRPGQSAITTPRTEIDHVDILSGIENGVTLGTPISLAVQNHDAHAQEYRDIHGAFRPSHADYTVQAKYGIRSASGGGRASARETVGRVAAGAIAQKLLHTLGGIEIVAYVKQIAEIEASCDPSDVTRVAVDATPIRCPQRDVAERMIAAIERARSEGDSIGGIIEAVARNVRPGLGEPVFDKLDADLAKAMLSLPAVKGFEVGSGFAATRMRGSQHNDLFYAEKQRVRTRTNYSGGIQGGISNGEPILIRVAFKPTATIQQPQATVDEQGGQIVLYPRGRHDPCVLPRAVPIVEAMMALVLADHYLRHRGQCG